MSVLDLRHAPSTWQCWLAALWDVLQTDDEACDRLIRCAGGHQGAVHLLEGDATTADALAYARTLSEMGHAAEAAEVLAEVLRVAFGAFDRLPRIEMSASFATA